MNAAFRKCALPAILMASTLLLGCATRGKPPPAISLDEPVQAQPLPEPPQAGGGRGRARGAADAGADEAAGGRR